MLVLSNLVDGLALAFTAPKLLCAVSGSLIGLVVGLLPGMAPAAMVALLLPVAVALDVPSALFLLAGLCAGVQHARSITEISRPTAGASLLPPGLAGMAMQAAGLGAGLAGCLAVLALALAMGPLANAAAALGPADKLALAVLGLTIAALLSSGSLLKAIAMAVLGLLLRQVATGTYLGSSRFILDMPELAAGVGLVVLALGVFGLSPIITSMVRPEPIHADAGQAVSGRWPSTQDVRQVAPAALRGTAWGLLLGVLPGSGALLASYCARALEGRLKTTPHEGHASPTALQVMAGGQAARQSGTLSSFIPLLTLGIPANAVMALIGGVLALKGGETGPQMITGHPDWVWGLMVSLWMGNLLLVLLHLPLTGLWVRLPAVPARSVLPAVVVLCGIGAYSLGHRAFDLYLVAAFMVLGHVFDRLGCPTAPMLLGFVLGPMMESNLRQALLAAHGDVSTLVARPLSAGALLLAAALVGAAVVLPSLHARRQQAFRDEH